MSFPLKTIIEQTKEKYHLTSLTPAVSGNHHISWVYVLEDIHNFTFLREGVLILTTGMILKTEEDLLHFVKKIWGQGSCGLILNVGMYLHDIPQSVIDWCNEHQYPLYTMPWEIYITDIMQEYCNAIISESRISDLRNHGLFQLLTGSSLSTLPEYITPEGSAWLISTEIELNISFYSMTRIDHYYYYLCDIDPHNLIFNVKENRHALSKLHIGISNEINCQDASPLELSEFFLNAKKQTEYALKVSLIKHAGITDYGSIGLYKYALSLHEPCLFEQAKEALRPLEDPILRETFRVYIEHGGSIQNVAASMYTHRNTINYRMARIRELLKKDISDETVRLEYLMAYYLLDCET